MDCKEEALGLMREALPEIIQMGTQVDELFRRFREIRLKTSDLSFQSAILNVEHSFFMVVQSLNILRDNLRLLEVAAKKKEIE